MQVKSKKNSWILLKYVISLVYTAKRVKTISLDATKKSSFKKVYILSGRTLLFLIIVVVFFSIIEILWFYCKELLMHIKCIQGIPILNVAQILFKIINFRQKLFLLLTWINVWNKLRKRYLVSFLKAKVMF